MGAQTLLPIEPATSTRSTAVTADIPVRVFLLSDHRLLRGALARALENQANISLVGAQESSLNTTAEIIKSACDVLLVDPVTTSVLDCQLLDHLQSELSGLRIVIIEMEAKFADVLSAILYRDLGHAEGPG